MVCQSTGIVNSFAINPNDTGAKSAFNENYAVTPISYIEGSATYNLIPSNFRTFTSNNGTVTTENRLFKISTSTTENGSALLKSFRSLPHRVGKSATGRFSGYFENNAANSEQGLGLITIGEEMSFGYNGTTFGIWHRYGGIAEVRTITITIAATGNETLTLTLNGIDYSIPLTIGTIAHNAYEIQSWLNANQLIWGANQIGSTVIINALSDGAKSGVYTYNSSGDSVGNITQNTMGVTKTSNFVAQSQWNGEALIEQFDPSKGNLYQISYQNMCWGEIKYFIVDRIRGFYVNVHTVRFVNTTTVSGLSNPAMRVGVYATSLGSTTNLNVYVNSFEAAIDGNVNRTRNPRSITATQDVTTTNETALLTLRNRKTYNYLTNQIEIEPLFINIANDTNRNIRIRVRTAVTTGIEQNFVSAGNNLVADIDRTPIVYTGGTLIASTAVAAAGISNIDLNMRQITLPPDLMMIITAERTAAIGGNNNIEATLDWYEDL
jgi:hypothetical protein